MTVPAMCAGTAREDSMIPSIRKIALAASVAAALISFAARLPADEPAATTGVTIEFLNTDNRPKAQYRLRTAIEFGNGVKPINLTTRIDAGASGTAICGCIAELLKSQKAWSMTQKDNKLILKEWTDPQTGVSHPVKRVTFTSDNMPKETLPKATVNGKKG